METASSQPTISEKARICLLSFKECLGKMAALDPQRQSLIENEFARFSVWTSNIGVFANGRASMDHRLREAPDVQRLVLGLLDVLHGRINKCMCFFFFLYAYCPSVQLIPLLWVFEPRYEGSNQFLIPIII